MGSREKLATTGFKQTLSAQSLSRLPGNVVVPAHDAPRVYPLHTYTYARVHGCVVYILYHRIPHTVHALAPAHTPVALSFRQHERQRAREMPENFRDNFCEAPQLSRLVTSRFRKPARVCETAYAFPSSLKCLRGCIVYMCISLYHFPYFAFAICNAFWP